MKGKTKLTSLLLIFIIFGIPSVLAGFVPGTALATKINLYDAANPGATPVVKGGQAYIEINDTYGVGDSFTVIANVTAVSELNMYAVGVEYDPLILDVSSFSEGTMAQNFFYLNVPAAAYAPVVNQPIPASGTGDGPGFGGDWEHITWALVKPYNTSGTGILAVFEFDVVGWGFSYIDIILGGAQVATLADPNAPPDEDYNTVDIIFDNMGIAPPAYGPTAEVKAITPIPPRYVDQLLTFTATNDSSVWGFSGAPLFVYYKLVLIEWDFMYTSAPGVNTDSGEQVTFTYTTPGTFDVNLTVTDFNGGKDSVLTSVTIFPLAEGAVVDIMTNRPPFNGTGPYMPASPYMAGKEEEVILYAKVLYNNCPVVNKLVTFGVFKVWFEGMPPVLMYEIALIRTAFTDENGMATVSYRIPTGWENESHGGYAARAYTFIGEGLVEDITTYRVEWVVDIVSVEALPPGTWAQGDTACFNVTIEAWDFAALPVVISLQLYDDLNCSISEVSCGPAGRPPTPGVPMWPCDWWSPTRYFYGDGTFGTLLLGSGTPPGYAWFVVCADIPRHAYVGVGTAYVNLHDAWPIPDMYAEPSGLTGDGQAYCPEASAAFGIECA